MQQSICESESFSIKLQPSHVPDVSIYTHKYMWVTRHNDQGQSANMACFTTQQKASAWWLQWSKWNRAIKENRCRSDCLSLRNKCGTLFFTPLTLPSAVLCLCLLFLSSPSNLSSPCFASSHHLFSAPFCPVTSLFLSSLFPSLVSFTFTYSSVPLHLFFSIFISSPVFTSYPTILVIALCSTFSTSCLPPCATAITLTPLLFFLFSLHLLVIFPLLSLASSQLLSGLLKRPLFLYPHLFSSLVSLLSWNLPIHFLLHPFLSYPGFTHTITFLWFALRPYMAFLISFPVHVPRILSSPVHFNFNTCLELLQFIKSTVVCLLLKTFDLNLQRSDQ